MSNQIDTTNSLGLNDQIAAQNSAQMMDQYMQLQQELAQETALTPESVNAAIQEVCGSQATNTH